ncbi:MAG: VWA domain-containing protein [Deltaproteobacteria bacterium]|nr:VWA domain-containing protein [Deltaproteobacteria bacterium]
MVYHDKKKGWIVRSTLIWAFLALSCSAESKFDISNAVGTSGSNSKKQGETTQGSISGTNDRNTGDNTDSNAPATELGEDVCAEANVRVSRIKPTILFVVDRSGSTADPYPGSTSKWQAMYDSLMDPNEGVITKLQGVAYFGMVLYDGGGTFGIDIAVNIVGGVFVALSCLLDPSTCPDGAVAADAAVSDCPRLVIVNPALNNYDAINAAYSPSLPGTSTPTALALEAAYNLLSNQPVIDTVVGDQYVVLCTDGLPNGCMTDINVPDQQGPIDQLTAAAKKGIKTYVIGVAATNDTDADAGTIVGIDAQAYLEELAKYGDTGTPAFSPATKGDLVDAISSIIGGAVGCKVKLNGEVVVDQRCLGTVRLNDQPLECDGADGWKLVSPNEIELQGDACQRFKSDPAAIVSASFPCEVIVIQ